MPKPAKQETPCNFVISTHSGEAESVNRAQERVDTDADLETVGADARN